MMNKEKKKTYIEEIKKFFTSRSSVFVTHYQGLNVKQLDQLRDEMRKLEASELEITLNPKISQYKLKNKVYPKGRSTMGMPGTKPRKAVKKWKPKK